VDIFVFVKIGGNSELCGVCAHIAYRNVCRLLHNVAECAGKLQLSRSVHHRGLDLEQISSHLGVRQTRYDSDKVFALADLIDENARTEIFFEA